MGAVVILNIVSLWKQLLYLCISAQLCCWWQLQYWLQHRKVRVLGLSERQVLYAKSCRHLPTLENKWASWSWNFFSQPKPHSQMGAVVILNIVALISSGTLWKHLLYLCISAQLCWWQLQYWLQHRMVRVLGLSERQILYAKSCRHLPTLENKWACWSLNCFSQPKPHSQLGTGTVVILNTVSLISSGTLWKHLLYLCISAQLCWWQLQYWLQHWLRCWLQYWLQRRMVRSPSGHWERPSRYGLIPCAKFDHGHWIQALKVSLTNFG